MSKPQNQIDPLAQEWDAALTSPTPAADPAAPAANKPGQAQPSLNVPGTVRADVSQGLRDAPNAIWRGITGAVNEADQTANSAVNWVSKQLGVSVPGYFQVGGNPDGSFLKWYSGQRDKAQMIGDKLIPARSTSTTGQLIESATQFGTGMMMFGKVLKVGEGASLAAQVGMQAVKGGLVDATMFDSYNKRLSNILQDHPALQNPVSAFFASNADDGVLKSKLKAGTEGMLTGAAFETFFQGLKILKQTRLFSDAPAGAAKDAAHANLKATVDGAETAVADAQAKTPFNVIETDQGYKVKGPGIDEALQNGQFTDERLRSDLGLSDGESLKDLHDKGLLKQADNGLHELTDEGRQQLVNSSPAFQDSATAHAQANTLNTLAEESTRPPRIQMTPEQHQAVRDEAMNLMTSSDPADVQRLAEGTDFNFPVTYKSTLEDAKANIEAMSKVMSEAIQEHRGEPVLTYSKLVDQVRNFYPEDDPEKILSDLGKLHGDTTDLPARMQAGLVEVQRAANRVSKLSSIADGAPNDPAAMDQLGKALDYMVQVHSYVKGSSTNVARALQVHQNDVSSVLEDVLASPNGGQEAAGATAAAGGAQATTGALDGMSADEMRGLARKVRLSANNPNAIVTAVKTAPRSMYENVRDAHNEYWMNSVLSGPRTTEVKFMSDMTNAITAPVEHFFAGVGSRNPQLMQQGADLFLGNIYSIVDAARGAAKAFAAGRNILDAPGSIMDAPQHAIGGYIGDLIRLPSRFMMSADEFAKQMSYRSNVRAQALREARELNLSGDAIGQYATDALNSAFNPNGKGLNKSALAYAEANTFTTPLDPTSVAGGLQKIVNDNPIARVILPFIKVPANLAYWTWERTPLLRQLNSSVRTELAAGGERAAIQQAKLGTGLSLYSLGAGLTAAGVITGHGPMNPELRKQWLQSHQPYSVRFGNNWYSYSRMEPFATPIGLIADAMQMSGELHDTDVQQVALHIAASMANNFTSKTYLEGIVNSLDTLTSGDENKWNKLIQQHAGSYVPNFLNQTNPDPVFREVRGVVDAMMARTPGLSKDLPPRMNMFGEPVMKAPGDLSRPLNPFTQMKAGGALEDKLLELGKAIPMPSKFPTTLNGERSGIDLTSTKYGTKGNLAPYDRMLQLTAQPGNGMPPLRDALTKLVSGPNWDQLSPGNEVYPGGIRFKLANDLVQKYRQIAYQKMLNEFPNLRKAVQQEMITKRVATVQGQAGVDRIQSLFNPQQQGTNQ